MEQNADTGTPVAPVMDNKQKDGNGLKIATAIACAIAVCGIGFGVYGIMQVSDKDSQISNLKTQIQKLESIEKDEEETNNLTETDVIDPANYIYIGEWGIKIDVSDLRNDETRIGYNYETHANVYNDSPSLSIGYDLINMRGDALEVGSAWMENIGGVAGLSRSDIELEDPGYGTPPSERLIVEIDGYYYYYLPPVHGSLLEDENDREKANELSKKLSEVIRNPQNYSKI